MVLVSGISEATCRGLICPCHKIQSYSHNMEAFAYETLANLDKIL